jgi:hypothetical protein
MVSLDFLSVEFFLTLVYIILIGCPRRRRIGGEMQNTYTAIVKQDGDWWIGWIEGKKERR